MKTTQIINRMNELEIGIQEVKVIYTHSIRELLEKQFQLRNELPKSFNLIDIDSELLKERALIIDTKLTKRLLSRFEENKCNMEEIESMAKTKSHKSDLAPELLQAKIAYKTSGKALFRAVFGDTKRYRLLDIDTIGENVYFGED